jgi:hypothetical protein
METTQEMQTTQELTEWITKKEKEARTVHYSLINSLGNYPEVDQYIRPLRSAFWDLEKTLEGIKLSISIRSDYKKKAQDIK